MLLLLLSACGTTTTAPGSLLRADVEPPGENCEHGGTALSAGVDDDGDGTLSDAEIDRTTFACDGADGATGADGTPGEDGEDGEDGATALLSLSDEAAGDNCAEGGLRVDSGVDDDQDGVLDPEEIDQTEYVCDGEPGAVSVVSVTEEAAGDNCPYGGQRVDTGVDTDLDGALGEGEITGTRYVCNGADGATGADGAAAVVSTTDEPAGDNCAAGGVAVSVGADDDGDGALGTDEVDTTFYVCDGASGSGGGVAGTIVVGDYTVSNSLEADLLDGVEQITGKLTIYGSEMGDIALPDLVQVGSLYVGGSNFAPDSISLPALTTVDGAFTVYDTELADWSGFDAIETVGGEMTVYYASGVTTLDAFRALTSVGGGLSIAGYTPIDGFDALTSVGGTLSVSGYGGAGVTGFDVLTTVAGLSLSGSSVTDLSGFTALETVTGTFTLYNLALTDLDDFASLTSVGTLSLSSLPSVTDMTALSGLTVLSGSVSINALTSLTSLSGLENITSVAGDFYVGSLTSLTSVSGLSGLQTVGGQLNLASLTALTNVDGLTSVTSVGDLYIQSNSALTNLDGLANMDIEDDGVLVLYHNAALTDISGLSGVSGTVEYLNVNDNDALPNLTGLEGVTRLGSSSSTYSEYALLIYSNASLSSLSGLNNVTAIDYGTNYIYGNSALCNTTVSALRTLIGTSDILGAWTTGSNKSC